MIINLSLQICFLKVGFIVFFHIFNLKKCKNVLLISILNHFVINLPDIKDLILHLILSIQEISFPNAILLFNIFLNLSLYLI
jgi:hypothetical protein